MKTVKYCNECDSIQIINNGFCSNCGSYNTNSSNKKKKPKTKRIINAVSEFMRVFKTKSSK